MTKITGKLQITLPKRLADSYGLKAGDEVDIVAAGDAMSLVPVRNRAADITVRERLRHFDAATKRQRLHEHGREYPHSSDRGWTREDIYSRGRAR